jgi:tryptophan synthase beta chain
MQRFAMLGNSVVPQCVAHAWNVLGAYLLGMLQDSDGQIIDPHSISAGLDYPGIGPEHAYLKDSGRVSYFAVTDKEAVDAFKQLSTLEGIIPALETSHAIAFLGTLCKSIAGKKIVVNCSGRGDKDINTVASWDLEMR